MTPLVTQADLDAAWAELIRARDARENITAALERVDALEQAYEQQHGTQLKMILAVPKPSAGEQP